MQILYLTPASIGYLTQFILSLGITIYLAHRFSATENRNTQTTLLTGFFCAITLFVGLLFLDAAALPTWRLYVVYLENTILGISLAIFLQFAYRFPTLFPRRKWESYLALGYSLLYTLYEAQYAVYRFSLLLGLGEVDYRPPQADYALVILFVWVPLAFLRQTISADERPVSWSKKLWKPQGLSAQGARSFALLYTPLIILGIINILRGTLAISTTTYNIFLSLGILIVLFLFATLYLTYLSESTSVLIKLSGTTLTLLLILLGIIGWVVTPDHVNAYQPALTDHQTLRFTPNTSGGYDIAEIAFQFDTNLGEKLPVTSRGEERNYLVKFDFPFHGKTYHEIYVTSVGLLSMGQKLYHPNLQNTYGNFAGIFPLLVDLEPAAGGGVFARAESDRLIVTWDHLAALHNKTAIFTFQTVLYQDGSFDFTYNGLPDPLIFNLDATPSANPWIRGETSGMAKPEQVINLSQPMQDNSQGFVQDFYLDFRHYLHHFISPLAWLILISSLILILGLPVLIRVNFIKPLNALLAGIKKMESGDLNVNMPIQQRDEIGSLTTSYNAMATQLHKHVNKLEEIVAERTRELLAANNQLKIEINERESVEIQVIQQQRELAAAEERERMARDLHDNFGQVIGFVNVQAQAVQTLLKKKQPQAAHENLAKLVQVTQDAHVDLRNYILGLRTPITPDHTFYEAVQAYLNAFQQAWGIKTVFSAAQDKQPLLSDTVEDHLLHIIQEALVNIRKHAEARRVEVLVSFAADEMLLIISDDGRGFDVWLAPGAEEKHFGLSIMRERAEQVGGQMELRSVVGNGTQVLISIPHIASISKPEGIQKNVLQLRILLVDDQPLFLDGMRNLLTARGLTVIGMAHDGFEAFEQARALHPDVILMDVQMPNCNGIEATRLIKADFPEIKIVLLTVSEEDEKLLDALKYGASGYLLKNMNASEIFSMLDQALHGETQIAPLLASRVLTEFSQAKDAPQATTFRNEDIPAVLTTRQWEVLRLVARGQTYKEVGIKLNLTERAIKYHMAQVLERLQLKSREDAVAYMRQSHGSK